MKSYDIGKYDDSDPILEIKSVLLNILGEHVESPFVRWGDVTFGLTTLDDVQDVNAWIHEFTEDAISDMICAIDGVALGGIVQLIGCASGIVVYYEGKELFAPLNHLLTSLCCGTFVSTENGYIFLNEDKFWNLLMENKKRNENESMVS